MLNQIATKEIAEEVEPRICDKVKSQHMMKPNKLKPMDQDCRIAILSGLVMENVSLQFSAFKGEPYISSKTTSESNDPSKTPLLALPFENLHIWTPRNNAYKNNFLLSEIDNNVLKEKWWKTSGYCLKLSLALFYNFESIPETSYNWIHGFNEMNDVDETRFLEDYPFLRTGIALLPDEFAKVAPILELLLMDEIFFTAAATLTVSFEAHEFCSMCFLGETHRVLHQNHEPKAWEQDAMIPEMETAIVQATRACEGILGKPSNKKERVKGRWKERLEIAPDFKFEVAGKSYFDFYYEDVFPSRGNAAHNLGKFAFALSRQKTMQIQSFALKIVRSYYKKNRSNHNDALKNLNFNQDLLTPVFKYQYLNQEFME